MTAPIVIYDAQCPLCRRQVAFLQRHTPPNALEYIPYQNLDLTRQHPQLKNHDLAAALHYLDPQGQVSSGAKAIYQLAQRIPLLRPLTPLYRLPHAPQLTQKLYHHIATRRHHHPNPCPHCQ